MFEKPTEAIALFNGIPFLNGGLFECLDKRVEVNGKPQTFAGTVAGDQIAGEFRGADGSRLPWRATRVRPAS